MTPPLITHEPTTTAPIDDSIATAAMHAALRTKGLLPRCHIVNAGYVDAERLAVSQRDDALDLWGALQGRVRWQAHGEGAFDLSRLVIDWERQQVTCPAGHTSLSWTPAIDNRDHDVINIKFAPGDCRDCRYRAQCSRNVRRTLTVRPQEPHEALMANRKRQSMPALKAEQARRCGIEGTRSYGVRTWDMRRARYSEDFTRVLARRLTTILPAMALAEALETTRIPRVANLTGVCTIGDHRRLCFHP